MYLIWLELDYLVTKDDCLYELENWLWICCVIFKSFSYSNDVIAWVA